LTESDGNSRTKLFVTVVIFIVMALMLLIPNIAMEEYIEPELLEDFDPLLLDEVWGYMEEPANRTWMVLSTYIERHIGDVNFTFLEDDGTPLRLYWWKESSRGWKWGIEGDAPVNGMNVTMDRYAAYMLYRTLDQNRNNTFHHFDNEVSDHIGRVGALYDTFDTLVKFNHITSPSQFDSFIHNTYNDFNAVRSVLAGEYYYNFNYFLHDTETRSVELGIWGSYSI